MTTKDKNGSAPQLVGAFGGKGTRWRQSSETPGDAFGGMARKTSREVTRTFACIILQGVDETTACEGGCQVKRGAGARPPDLRTCRSAEVVSAADTLRYIWSLVLQLCCLTALGRAARVGPRNSATSSSRRPRLLSMDTLTKSTGWRVQGWLGAISRPALSSHSSERASLSTLERATSSSIPGGGLASTSLNSDRPRL